MSHSNSTTNYSLPQFINTDKPAWLTDINGAFADIDTSLKAVSDAANTADGKAVAAQTAASDVETKIDNYITANTTVSKVVVANGIYTSITKTGDLLTISAYNGATATPVQANDDIINISDYPEFAGLKFLINSEVLDTYDHTSRIFSVANGISLGIHSALAAGAYLRYTITIPVYKD